MSHRKIDKTKSKINHKFRRSREFDRESDDDRYLHDLNEEDEGLNSQSEDSPQQKIQKQKTQRRKSRKIVLQTSSLFDDEKKPSPRASGLQHQSTMKKAQTKRRDTKILGLPSRNTVSPMKKKSTKESGATSSTQQPNGQVTDAQRKIINQDLKNLKIDNKNKNATLRANGSSANRRSKRTLLAQSKDTSSGSLHNSRQHRNRPGQQRYRRSPEEYDVLGGAIVDSTNSAEMAESNHIIQRDERNSTILHNMSPKSQNQAPSSIGKVPPQEVFGIGSQQLQDFNQPKSINMIQVQVRKSSKGVGAFSQEQSSQDLYDSFNAMSPTDLEQLKLLAAVQSPRIPPNLNTIADQLAYLRYANPQLMAASAVGKYSPLFEDPSKASFHNQQLQLLQTLSPSLFRQGAGSNLGKVKKGDRFFNTTADFGFGGLASMPQKPVVMRPKYKWMKDINAFSSKFKEMSLRASTQELTASDKPAAPLTSKYERFKLPKVSTRAADLSTTMRSPFRDSLTLEAELNVPIKQSKLGTKDQTFPEKNPKLAMVGIGQGLGGPGPESVKLKGKAATKRPSLRMSADFTMAKNQGALKSSMQTIDHKKREEHQKKIQAEKIREMARTFMRGSEPSYKKRFILYDSSGEVTQRQGVTDSILKRKAQMQEDKRKDNEVRADIIRENRREKQLLKLNVQSMYDMNNAHRSKKVIDPPSLSMDEEEIKQFEGGPKSKRKRSKNKNFNQFLALFNESQGDIDTFMVKLQALPTYTQLKVLEEKVYFQRDNVLGIKETVESYATGFINQLNDIVGAYKSVIQVHSEALNQQQMKLASNISSFGSAAKMKDSAPSAVSQPEESSADKGEGTIPPPNDDYEKDERADEDKSEKEEGDSEEKEDEDSVLQQQPESEAKPPSIEDQLGLPLLRRHLENKLDEFGRDLMVFDSIIGEITKEGGLQPNIKLETESSNDGGISLTAAGGGSVIGGRVSYTKDTASPKKAYCCSKDKGRIVRLLYDLSTKDKQNSKLKKENGKLKESLKNMKKKLQISNFRFDQLATESQEFLPGHLNQSINDNSPLRRFSLDYTKLSMESTKKVSVYDGQAGTDREGPSKKITHSFDSKSKVIAASDSRNIQPESKEHQVKRTIDKLESSIDHSNSILSIDHQKQFIGIRFQRSNERPNDFVRTKQPTEASPINRSQVIPLLSKGSNSFNTNERGTEIVGDRIVKIAPEKSLDSSVGKRSLSRKHAKKLSQRNKSKHSLQQEKMSRDYRNTQALNMVIRMLQLIKEYPIHQVVKEEHKEKSLVSKEKGADRSERNYFLMSEAQLQALHNRTQILKIETSLQTELERVCFVERCFLLQAQIRFSQKYWEPNSVFLTNKRDIHFQVEKGSFLNEVIKNGKMVTVHEGTRDKINIAAHLSKLFGFRVFNACFVPVVIDKFLGGRKNTSNTAQFGSRGKRIYIICLINHRVEDEVDKSSVALLDGASPLHNKFHGSNQNQSHTQDSGAKYSNFDLQTLVCTHPLFSVMFSHLFSLVKYTENVIYDQQLEKKILNLVESVLSSLSMKKYVLQCEKDFKSIFNCERVNMVLVDRFKKDLFRYVQDENNPRRLITKSYSIDQGLAGYVAVSCHTVFTDKLSDENRYLPEVDDPGSLRDGEKPARQLISVPVFAKTDREELQSEHKGQNSLSNYPRAIIQLINKKDSDGFSTEDINKVEFLSQLIGRCHDCITKVEQLHCMKSVSEELMSATQTIGNNLEENMTNYKNLRKSMKDFFVHADQKNPVPLSQSPMQQYQ